MAKPATTDIDSEAQNWETTVNDNFGAFEDGPVPIYENAATSLAALETAKPAASYDRCLCFFNDSTLGWTLARSNGTAWKIIGIQAADVGALSITMPADTPATADALRDDLVANALAEIQSSINGLRTALQNAGLMA